MTNPRFRFPWRRSRAAIVTELDAELEFHLAARTEELVAKGMSSADARREAEREFGDLSRTRAYCEAQDVGLERATRRRDRLDETLGNIRFAFRSLRRSPGFTAITLTTLALAIGANTAIFSVANAILLAPLPYDAPGRLVSLFENNTLTGYRLSDMSAADLTDYRDRQSTLTGIGILARNGAIFRTRPDDPVALQNLRVSANMFTVLGARARYGRAFTAADDGVPPAAVAILSYDAWMRLYGGDTTAVGRTVFVNDQPVTLIGIMPRGFGIGYAEDLYTALDMTPQLRDVNRARKMHWLYAVARLKPGTSIDAARADLDGIAHAIEKAEPDVNKGHYATLVPMQTALAGSSVRVAYLLLGAAGLVLLVACANLINMMLARATSRGQELAVRAAIGAGRSRLIAQLVTESVVLAAIGGALGVGIATLTTNLIVRISPAALPTLAKPALDWRVLTFAIVVSLVVGVLVGIIPALRVSRADLGAALRRSGRGGDRHGNKLRAAFVTLQTAMAVVLLVVGGLLTRSLMNLRAVNPGFDAEHVLVGAPIVRGARYQSKDAFNAFYEAMFERLRALPGVSAVGASAGVPLIGSSGCGLVIEGRPLVDNIVPDVRCSAARGDYFKALSIPLLRGRSFDATDLPNGTQVVVVNQAVVRKFFPNEDPIGKRIRLGPDPSAPWETIVGIVGDVRENSLEELPAPAVTEYAVQHTWGTLTIVVRTAEGDPMRVEPAFRAAARETDPLLAVRMVRSMEYVVGVNLAARRLTMTLIASFAVLALLLAAVGIYGVLAFGVTARTREFGIRRALGATAGSVRRSAVSGGLVWVASGLVVGSAGAALAGRAVRTMLYDVQPVDIPTFIGVAAVLCATAFIACVVPARRATKIDPVIAMRAE